MKHFSTLLLSMGALAGVCSFSAEASAQSANSYCPLYADNNWRLSWVEKALSAWTKDNRGSTSFDAHLSFCKDVFRDDPDNALEILYGEWETRHARIVDRLPNWKAQDMVAYLEFWPDRMSYICDIYAGHNVGLSQIGQYLNEYIGSEVESEHRDYCVNTIYQNNDRGLEVQQAWAERYERALQLVWEHAAR